MATQEVDVKPYGTSNEAGTRSYGNTPMETTVEIKPPYGARNEAEIRSTHPQQTSGYQSQSGYQGGSPSDEQTYQRGSRSDVEVKPYGTSEQTYQRETLLKPQQTTYQQQQRVSRPLDLDQLKNPLLATALGVTLALLLWSLLQVPKSISHWWYGDKDLSVQRSYEYYPREWSREREYPREREYFPRDYQSRESWRGMGRDASWKAGETYQAAKDTMYRAKDRAGEMYENAKDTGESLYNRAKDTITGGSGGGYWGGGYTEESKGMACKAAERARDMACGYDTRDSYWSRGSSWYPEREGPIEYARERGREAMDYARDRGREAMDDARYNTREAQSRMGRMYENAKHRASDILEGVKDTVTYPVRAARETMGSARDTTRDTAYATQERARDMYESAKDTVTYPMRAARDTVESARDAAYNTGERARDMTGSTVQAAKDTVRHAAEAVKDTVVGAKDTVVGAGEAVKNAAGSAVQGVRDTVTGAAERVRETVGSSREDIDAGDYQGRGPTKVRVEVQEM